MAFPRLVFAVPELETAAEDGLQTAAKCHRLAGAAGDGVVCAPARVVANVGSGAGTIGAHDQLTGCMAAIGTVETGTDDIGTVAAAGTVVAVEQRVPT